MLHKGEGVDVVDTPMMDEDVKGMVCSLSDPEGGAARTFGRIRAGDYRYVLGKGESLQQGC